MAKLASLVYFTYIFGTLKFIFIFFLWLYPPSSAIVSIWLTPSPPLAADVICGQPHGGGGKFLRVKVCRPESWDFLGLWGIALFKSLWKNRLGCNTLSMSRCEQWPSVWFWTDWTKVDFAALLGGNLPALLNLEKVDMWAGLLVVPFQLLEYQMY